MSTTTTTPHEPRGYRFFDLASGRDMILVDAGQPYAGWLCYRHPDGQWVTSRKATGADLEKLGLAGTGLIRHGSFGLGCLRGESS